MDSPFPGMDPYLEDPAYWEDFHRSFITYLRDALLEALPSNYDARIDQRIRIVDATEHRDVWIDIFHLPERSLVTVIEVLSPSNKSGDGASEFRNKHTDLYSRHVNLLAIDLLPAIPVPLKPSDPDVLLAMGKVFATVYERGRYSGRLRYQSPAPVPLGEQNTSWANGLLRAAGRCRAI
jgi:hypothetical protein